MIFVTLKQAVTVRPIRSLGQESTNPKVQKLSLGNQPQRHVEDQTHTRSTKIFTRDLRFCSWAHLDHHSQNPQLKHSFP